MKKQSPEQHANDMRCARLVAKEFAEHQSHWQAQHDEFVERQTTASFELWLQSMRDGFAREASARFGGENPAPTFEKAVEAYVRKNTPPSEHEAWRESQIKAQCERLTAATAASQPEDEASPDAGANLGVWNNR